MPRPEMDRQKGADYYSGGENQVNRQKHEAHYAICHDARAEFARTLFVHAHHFARGIFLRSVRRRQSRYSFSVNPSIKIDSMISRKTDIVSSIPTTEPPTVNPSSIHAPRIVSIIYFSPIASFALKELYHTHNAAVKETPSATSQTTMLLFCGSK